MGSLPDVVAYVNIMKSIMFSGKQPEPDDFSDKTANSDFRSKLDYFKALEDSDRVLVSASDCQIR